MYLDAHQFSQAPKYTAIYLTESRACISIRFVQYLTTPPPKCMTSNPALDSSFLPFAKNVWKRPYLAVSPLNQASSKGLCSLYQLFLKDLPPQSHKSTEDRCLLCLIKALPPGVILQFEQEEKPSEGGNVLDQFYEGPVLYTVI